MTCWPPRGSADGYLYSADTVAPRRRAGRAGVVLLGAGAAARALARSYPGVEVISSLAGRVPEPALPAGEVRIGGFGGEGPECGPYG